MHHYGLSQMKKCVHCKDGYMKKNGILVPCKYCITPERFEATLEKALKNCGPDSERKRVLRRVQSNLPNYPIMAVLEAENYGKFSIEFVSMLRNAYDLKPFMDVKYRHGA
jgi:hypothetical protein